MKIKVLHRVSTAGFGGLEKYVIERYKHMDRSRIQFDFLTRNRAIAENEEVKELGIRIRTFKSTERDDRNQLIHEISDILSDGYDVLHMNTSMWAGFLIEELAMKQEISKVIVHAHNAGVGFDDPQKRKKYKELHEYYKQQFNESYATHFFACSKAAANFLYGSQIDKKRIRVLKNAVDVQKYKYSEEIRNRIRKEWGLRDEFVIGNVGRLTYQKNQEFLLSVFANAYRLDHRIRLVMVGDGEQRKNLEQISKEQRVDDAVIFLGWKENVEEIMQGFDLFVLPSRFEGLPLVAVEAQAAGLPVLLSDTITDETVILDTTERIPLDENIWVEKICENVGKLHQRYRYDEVVNAGFDIKDAARELEEIYLGA